MVLGFNEPFSLAYICVHTYHYDRYDAKDAKYPD